MSLSWVAASPPPCCCYHCYCCFSAVLLVVAVAAADPQLVALFLLLRWHRDHSPQISLQQFLKNIYKKNMKLSRIEQLIFIFWHCSFKGTVSRDLIVRPGNLIRYIKFQIPTTFNVNPQWPFVYKVTLAKATGNVLSVHCVQCTVHDIRLPVNLPSREFIPFKEFLTSYLFC